MNRTEIKEKIKELQEIAPGMNLSPSQVDRESIRSRKQLTLAVLEVALQLADIVEDGFPGLENVLRSQ
jgi:hypothetical protein